MEKKSVDLEIKQFDAESRLLAGYASTFGMPADVQGDVIVKGAFIDSIAKIKSEGIPLLDSHKQDSEHVLGTVIDAFEDDHGLYITAKLADTPRVEEIRQKLKQGHINKMSIGFFIGKQDFKTHNGEEYRFISKADLIEVSVVPIPANSRATILSVKNNDTAPVSESPVEAVSEVSEDNIIDPTACKHCSGSNEPQEDGVRAESVTESASSCQTPVAEPDKKGLALEQVAELLQQSLNNTRRKYNGK